MKTALDLGCGDLKEANSLTEYHVIAVDRKIEGVPLPHVTFIEGDYFDMEFKGEFDLIYSDYSICFNRRERIEENFPRILSLLRQGGILIIRDFSSEEKVVQKRTNLDEEWFFELLRKNVGTLKIERKEVYEENHKHTHHLLIMTCQKV